MATVPTERIDVVENLIVLMKEWDNNGGLSNEIEENGACCLLFLFLLKAEFLLANFPLGVSINSSNTCLSFRGLYLARVDSSRVMLERR